MEGFLKCDLMKYLEKLFLEIGWLCHFSLLNSATTFSHSESFIKNTKKTYIFKSESAWYC